MRSLFAWIALAVTAAAQQSIPGVPPGWSVYIVHAPWCGPCNKFRSDYHTIDEFRNRLESAFSVKSVEWDKLSEQRFARRFAIASLPGFIVFRNGIHQQSFSGYNGDWKAFLERLGVDVDGPGGALDGTPAPVRPVTPEERELPRISALETEIDKLRRLIADAARNPVTGAKPAQSGAVPGIDDAAGTSREPVSLPATSASLPLIAAAQPSAGGDAGAGVGADWAKLGAAAVTLLAPQFALPAGAVATAITAVQWLRKRKTLASAQRPAQNTQTIVERPVVVATDIPPAPARVVTTNQFVPIDTDTTADALTWATAQLVKQYPGAEGTVAMLGSLMEQHKAAQTGGRGNGNK
jgi:hypothetical protein